MRKLSSVCLLATLAVVAAGTASAQTVSTTLDFIGTGTAAYTEPNNWVEVLVGNQLPDPNILLQTLGQNRVPSVDDTAQMFNGATVTLNSVTDPIRHVFLGSTGIVDPNFGDTEPNFKYLPMPTTTFNIGTGAVLWIDPNKSQDTGKGGNTQIGGFYNGTLNQTGGSFLPCWFRLGEGKGSTGIYNLSGGSLILRYRANIGRGGSRTGWQGTGINEWGSGYGEVNMSGGYFGLSGEPNATTQMGLWVGTTGSATTNIIDPNTGNPTVVSYGGNGVFNLSGGTVVGVMCRTGKYEYYTNGIDPWGGYSPCTGTVNISGGSFANQSNLEVGSAGGYGELNVTGNGMLTVNGGYLALSQAGTGTMHGGQGVMHVGIDASVKVHGPTDANSVVFVMRTVASYNAIKWPKLIMDVTQAKSAVIQMVGGSAALAGTLNVNSLDQWRPDKYGDPFATLVTFSGGGSGSGNFDTYTSNLTRGADPNDPNLFAGAWDPNAGNAYVLKFYGFNAGDANKDWSVGLIDLGRVSLNYGQSGKSWEDGDFTGEGSVGLTDLGKLSLYYGWTKPAGAPVPEPATMALLALGGAALIRRRRR